jgi:hypothetical protein
VTVAPQKAGTKKKPANTSLHLVIVNNNVHRTLSKLAFQFPKTVRMSGKGMKFCNKAQLEASTDPTICPKASKVGVGTAVAWVGVDQPSPQKLTFDVIAFLVGKNGIDFYLHAHELTIDVVSPGTVKQTKKGPRLTIQVPESAQKLGPVYNGLGSLDTVISKKIGSHKLISTVGCVKHKDKVNAKLTFVTNPATVGGTLPVSAAAKCR